MDPLRSDTRPAEALSTIERDARIEQLLLAGLDEYFAHRYEHAINLWTRVLFLDRQHDRARAYIERARRAQAERQRESEAALHQAIEALRVGDVARARELVTQALDRGASPDEAHGMLERIERLGVAQKSPKLRRRTAVPAGTWSSDAAAEHQLSPARHRRAWSAGVLLTVAAVGVLGVAAWGLATPDPPAWFVFSSPSAHLRVMPWTPDPLPVPSASELHIARARVLIARGHVYDAQRILAQIPVGDPLHAEAERLRAAVQQHLLSIATTEQRRE